MKVRRVDQTKMPVRTRPTHPLHSDFGVIEHPAGERIEVPWELAVLYTEKGKDKDEWKSLAGNKKAKRLREVYWADHAAKPLRAVAFDLTPRVSFPIERGEMDGGPDKPGDYYIAATRGRDGKLSIEWVEVTEVFWKPGLAQQVEAVMQKIHGIREKSAVDVARFMAELGTRQPCRNAQQRTADLAVEAALRKATKRSYAGLAERLGRGILIVGLPLWYAGPTLNPERRWNAVDDFTTRVKLGLEKLRAEHLDKDVCPFKEVRIAWVPSREALEEWQHKEKKMVVSGRKRERAFRRKWVDGMLTSGASHAHLCIDVKRGNEQSAQDGQTGVPYKLRQVNNRLQIRFQGRKIEAWLGSAVLTVLCKLWLAHKLVGWKTIAALGARRLVPKWARVVERRNFKIYMESTKRKEARVVRLRRNDKPR